MFTCINNTNINNSNFSLIFNLFSYISCSFKNIDEYIFFTNYEELNDNNNININVNDNYNNINTFNITLENMNNSLESINSNFPETSSFFKILSVICITDFLLILAFGYKARWYQLHSIINLYVTILIFNEFIEIILNPNFGYLLIKNHYPSYFIINLHLYHVLTFRNLSYCDYFHHILFVVFGVIPNVVFIKTNQFYLGYIPCSGIPGIIEYFILSLYKNNKISLLKQKYINLINYNYFRYPLCIIGVSYNFINYRNGNINDNLYLTIYLNFLLFLNGSLFNYLTLESYFKKKYIKLC